MRALNPTRILRSERGQSLVEFALVLPLFLILVFGIIDFGNGLRHYITVSNAAREGARLGAVDPDADIAQRVLDTAAADGLTLSDVDVTFPGGTQRGQPVVVDVEYVYEPITPLGHWIESIADGLTISTTARMRLE